MTHPLDGQQRARKYPFVNMRISDHSILDTIEGRHNCRLCNRSRKFFCYSCYIPVGELEDLLPRLALPLQIDIIKHKKEIDGKSSAVHAAVLAPEHVRIHTFPDIPDYREETGVVLIFPSATALTVPQLFERNVQLQIGDNYGLPKGHHMGTMLRRRMDEVEIEEHPKTPKTWTLDNLPIRRAVFIDSTWNQSRGIYADERIRGLRTVVLQNRLSQFWRHQRGSPRWYLATIEAIHQFLLEVHINAWGLNSGYRGLDNLEITEGFHQLAAPLKIDASIEDVDRLSPYNGQYDNLLFFFANMYDLIHKYYDHNDLISYRRPI
ncbi:tRNA-uridine aminocarboxypropyltransferase 1 [Drosophila takahashii]|uniref:tRNA-uridine aminocarboxypropyltransferase 1 n=1 Tax=Drosophila takahashii TaxID=29030 RepID=UPI001CF81E84|nr:tRNA-uridine aminocarboxypropyltransferase 1 [Drosophila takahashii]